MGETIGLGRPLHIITMTIIDVLVVCVTVEIDVAGRVIMIIVTIDIATYVKANRIILIIII